MKNVLITGISGGIGLAVADRLLSEGNSVIGVDRNISERASELSDDFGKKIYLTESDLMDLTVTESLVKDIVSTNGPIGGFVHCAGFDRMAPIPMTKPDDIKDLWTIHALVPMTIISSLIKKKNHTEGTSIVLITSQSAHEGAMGHTAYAAAKGAIEGYLAPAAAELMEKGIRINEVCFAPVRTQMSEGWMNCLTEESREKILDSYPLGIGNVDEAADLICFLMSERSKWINGQIITADGGHSVRKV